MWIQEYKCGCSAQNRSCKNLLGYCAMHDNEPIATYRMDESSSLFAARMELQKLRADLAAARAEIDRLREHEHEWSEAHSMLTGKFEMGYAMTHPEGAHTELGKAAEALNMKVDALRSDLAAARAALEVEKADCKLIDAVLEHSRADNRRLRAAAHAWKRAALWWRDQSPARAWRDKIFARESRIRRALRRADADAHYDSSDLRYQNDRD